MKFEEMRTYQLALELAEKVWKIVIKMELLRKGYCRKAACQSSRFKRSEFK